MENESYSYEVSYTDQFLKDVQAHKKAGQKAILTKINTLVDELREHPYTGTGNPEPLKGDRRGQWSRRINQKHRLIYEVNDNTISVLLVACMGHYDDK